MMRKWILPLCCYREFWLRSSLAHSRRSRCREFRQFKPADKQALITFQFAVSVAEPRRPLEPRHQ